MNNNWLNVALSDLLGVFLTGSG